MSVVRRPESAPRSVLAALLIAAAGVATANVFTLPPVLFEPALAGNPADASWGWRVLVLALNFLGFVAVGAAYLWYTDRDRSWLDLAVPSLREWLAALAGIAGSIVFLFAVGIVSMQLGVQPTSNQVLNFVGGDPSFVLVLIALVVLLNAPAEEFLFRNVVQKRLYAAASKPAAVVLASVIFALVHIPSYLLQRGGGIAAPSEIAVPLIGVFGGSLIFGYLYARTDNLVVPIAAHAGFNTFQFINLYLALRFAPEQVEQAQGLVLSLVGA